MINVVDQGGKAKDYCIYTPVRQYSRISRCLQREEGSHLHDVGDQVPLWQRLQNGMHLGRCGPWKSRNYKLASN